MRENADVDEMPLEVAPCDNSNDEWSPDDVELNTVTINSMSIDGKALETVGKRGRNREITVENPKNGRTLI